MVRAIHLVLLFLLVGGLAVAAIVLQSWGALALLVSALAGWTWYRLQVARSASVERFFGDAGDDTRVTSFAAGAPSDLPTDQKPPQQAR